MQKMGFVIAVLLIAGCATKKPPETEPEEVLDCELEENKSCFECSGSGLLCCFEEDCKVINRPPPPQPVVDPGEPAPTPKKGY